MSEIDAALYEEAYSSALRLHSLRRGIYSTAVIPAGATAPPSHTLSAFGHSGNVAVQQANEFSFFSALLGLLMVAAITLSKLILWTCTHIVIPAVILFLLVDKYILWGQWLGDIAVNLRQFGAVVRDAADDGSITFTDHCKARMRQFGRSIRQNKFVRAATVHSRRLLIWIELRIDNLSYNWFWDTAYLRWQEMVAYLAQKKLLLLAGVIFTCVLSLAVEEKQNQSGVKFVDWNEFQGIWSRPLPETLLREHKESGSNSHYERDSGGVVIEIDAYGSWPAIEEAAIGKLTETMEEAIPVTAIVDEEPEAIVAPSPSERVEDVLSDMGESWRGWCESCRQWHCCELPY